MKQLVCEMCGNTDLIKQDSVFVCQTCRCKYSVEEAKKMMVEGTVQVEGTVKIDNTDQAKTFKDIAINAYNAGSTQEAYTYFLKALEIDPTDFQTVFYKGMCLGWESTLASPHINEAVNAYDQAVKLISDNEATQTIKELFVSDLVNLMTAWFDMTCERFRDTDEYYAHNLSVFWDYIGTAEKCLDYFDNFMDVIIESTSIEFKKNVGELYCDCCNAICTSVVEYLDYSKKKALFPGLKENQKEKYTKKYDYMVFEVRKVAPDFRKIGNKYSCIDRVDPPTSIGSHNLRRLDINYQRCLEVDHAINQRVKQYKEEKIRKEKEEKERQYWESHPADKEKYQFLKEKYDFCSNATNSAQSAKISAETICKQYEDVISELKGKIAASKDTIAKQQKKIFGKAKAQEAIQNTQREIEEYNNSIADHNKRLAEAKIQREEAVRACNQAHSVMQSSKNAYGDFIRQCGLN